MKSKMSLVGEIEGHNERELEGVRGGWGISMIVLGGKGWLGGFECARCVCRLTLSLMMSSKDVC